jgi:hypothetical protein
MKFDSDMDLALSQIRGYAEKVVLPLRIGSPGRVIVGSGIFGREVGDEFLTEGTNQPAPVPSGSSWYADLSQEDSELLATWAPMLAYEPKYELALSYFTNAYYSSTLTEAGLAYLLALETLFAPNQEGRGRSDNVSLRASAFAATSKEQRRRMRSDIVMAYEHRGTPRHGENRLEVLDAAHQWFADKLPNLQCIAAWAIQRVLFLNRTVVDFDVLSFAGSIQQGNQQALNQIFHSPLFWVDTGRELIHLSPGDFRLAGGGTFELLGDRTLQRGF